MIRPAPGHFHVDLPLPTLLDDEPPLASRLSRVVLTTAAVLGLHGLVYYLATASAPPPQQQPIQQTAIMVNLAPIAVSAKSEVDNTTPGPQATESESMEEAHQTPPPPDPDPIPDLKPPPPDVKPVVELPTPPPKPQVVQPKMPETKVEPKKEPPKKVVKPVEKRSGATKASGGPKSNVSQAKVAAASAAGSESSQVSNSSWRNQVRSQIVSNKHYPSAARSLGQTGSASVSVTISGNGALSAVQLVASAGASSLDAEAVAVVHRSAPFPPPPGNRTATLVVPINFNRF